MRRVVIFLVLLTACYAPPADQADSEGWQGIGRGVRIKEITLIDGTHCVVTDGDGTGGSISCDWSPR